MGKNVDDHVNICIHADDLNRVGFYGLYFYFFCLSYTGVIFLLFQTCTFTWRVLYVLLKCCIWCSLYIIYKKNDEIKSNKSINANFLSRYKQFSQDIVSKRMVILTSDRWIKNNPFFPENTIAMKLYSLQWRHNGRDGVSNHQVRDYLLNRFLKRRSKKTSKLRVTGLCAGNSPVTG